MLLDLRLPGMDGYEVARQIREREAQGGVGEEYLPIIALTGMATERERQRCLQAGMDDFLAKPFAVDKFIATTRRVIGLRQKKKRLPARGKSRGLADATVLTAEIFNENDALRKFSGNRERMVARLTSFIEETPQALERIRKYAGTEVHMHLLEQEVHGLKEKAMEVGATSFADELFSLLMKIRKNQDIQDESNQGEGERLSLEFARFRQHPRVRELCSS
jgi:hypothetical protein